MTVTQFSLEHPLWQSYLNHTQRHHMRRWLVNKQFQPLPDTYYLGYTLNNEVIGHLAVKKQIIEAPQTPWSDKQGYDRLIQDQTDSPLTELFVQTFAVDKNFRRQGIGEQLQHACLKLGQKLACYQVRSWSSLDKMSNYQLKIKLGFAIHPGFYELSSGERISGVYFVKCCI